MRYHCLSKIRQRTFESLLTLNERILTESEVQMMIALEPNERNQAILKLLYYGALRVSELVALKWRDMVERQEGGQVTVYGKGGKTRTILLPGANLGRHTLSSTRS
jgi:integrase/recombinase XerD